MSAIGIVAEYNPFHKGHQYHIEETLASHSSDGIVVVMSGNFVQRGACAIYDKWVRTRMALLGGADLVLELPVCFATRSAAYFALGALQTLSATGIVDTLSCGVESQAQLSEYADILATEPPDYQVALQEGLQRGLSFPSARQQAFIQLGHSEGTPIETPNNILALAYQQTILQAKLPIETLFISRKGNYHNTGIPNEQQFAGASAIRNWIRQSDAFWETQVPPTTLQLIHQLTDNGISPMHWNCYEDILISLLRRTSPKELALLPDMNEGLENRIWESARQTTDIEELIHLIKSKRYTYTRIQRHLLHILLNMTQEDCFDEPEYIRILGFNQTGRQLIKTMRKKTSLPLITRPAAQKKQLSEKGRAMLDLDCRATDIYCLGYSSPQLKKCGLDYLTQPIQT